jgi:hypothetical protein
MADHEIHDLEMKISELEKGLKNAGALAEYALERVRIVEKECLENMHKVDGAIRRLDRMEGNNGT